MRILMVFAAVVVLAGGFISTFEAPEEGGSSKLLSSYRIDPDATLLRVENAMLGCVPDMAKTTTGRKFAKSIVAPFYVRTLELSAETDNHEAFAAQIQKWLIENQPDVLTKLPDEDFLELISHLQKIGEDDVESCILSTAV